VDVAKVEPWRLELRAGQRYVVDLDDGRLAGIGAFGVEIRSFDDQPVAASVVRRAVDGLQGLAVRAAAVVAARGWVVDIADRYGAMEDVMAVMNPAIEGIATIEVKVLAGTAPDGMARIVELAPGTQASFDLQAGPPLVLAVEATAPVIVSVQSIGESGATASVAVAVAGTEQRIIPNR
jgi:hypothetical protein